MNGIQVTQQQDMDDQETHFTDNVSQLPVTPGQKLRQAREKKGLSREAVASKLFLHQGYIQSLEEDNYKRLPGPTFVKGYMRSYCKLLEIPSEPIVQLYMEQAHLDDEHSGDYQDTLSLTSTYQKDKFQKNSAWGVWHLVVVLLIGAGIWALWQQPWLSQDLNQIEYQTTSETPMVSSKTEETEAALSESGAEITVSGMEKPTQPVGNDNPVVVTVIREGKTLLIGEPDKSREQDQLEVYFIGSAQVDITDSSGAYKHKEEHAAGALIEVRGLAPFTFSVNRPDLVTVSFNQQAVDIGAYLSPVETD